MEAVPQRELRNNVAKVLRRVEQGERLRVTVDGRPVADLVPIAARRTFVPRPELLRVLAGARLDPGFRADVDHVLGDTVDDL